METLPTISLVVLGSVLIAAGGYALNDVFDYRTDVATHRHRVLPRGEIDRATARGLALFLLIGSPLLFLPINRLSFVDASLVALLLFLYSWRLKTANGVLGNLVVAVLAANSALIGGFALGNVAGTASLAACVFLSTVAREMVKDIEDLPGDRATRTQTLPMLIGPRASAWVAAFSLLLAVPATYLPYAQATFGKTYLVAASFVNVLVVWTAARLTLIGDSGAALSQRLIKAEMFLYIVIFLFAALSGVLQGG
jgi:geranylgeranylglycerol-phosphate geranylgeranyltransferase